MRLPGLAGLLGSLLAQPSNREHPERWLQEASRKCARFLDLRVKITGNPPQEGLLVANHLSYLDIMAAASEMPCRFVAKSEVAAWPVFGRLAQKGGTIFVDRSSRQDVQRVGKGVREVLQSKCPVVLFAEGTSSDGSSVLPFHSSLLHPALGGGCPVTPLHFSYSLPVGSVELEVAYWGEMTLFPHLIRLLGRREITAHLHFGEPEILAMDRKRAAVYLREKVRQLAPPSPCESRQAFPVLAGRGRMQDHLSV